MRHRLKSLNQCTLCISTRLFVNKYKIELSCDPTTPCLGYLPEVNMPQIYLCIYSPVYYCAKFWKPASTNEQIKIGAHTQSEALVSHTEQNWSFVGKWRRPEIAVGNEVSQKDKCHMFSLLGKSANTHK